MKRKTWALASLALLLAAIAAISLTVIVIDPFQVYRPATRYLPPIDRTTQVYANAGVARSYAYDSAIVGTSVTENFRPSQMDSLLGGRFIKLCTSAGTAYNHALLMDLAFRTHDMRRIVYGLDVYSFIARLDQTGSDVPLYLYDDSLLLAQPQRAGHVPAALPERMGAEAGRLHPRQHVLLGGAG